MTQEYIDYLERRTEYYANVHIMVNQTKHKLDEN